MSTVQQCKQFIARCYLHLWWYLFSCWQLLFDQFYGWPNRSVWLAQSYVSRRKLPVKKRLCKKAFVCSVNSESVAFSLIIRLHNLQREGGPRWPWLWDHSPLSLPNPDNSFNDLRQSIPAVSPWDSEFWHSWTFHATHFSSLTMATFHSPNKTLTTKSHTYLYTFSQSTHCRRAW